MTPNTGFGLVAGLSVTAVVAATSAIDRSARRSQKKQRGSQASEQPNQGPAAIRRSASQETPYVFGNMILNNNM